MTTTAAHPVPSVTHLTTAGAKTSEKVGQRGAEHGERQVRREAGAHRGRLTRAQAFECWSAVVGYGRRLGGRVGRGAIDQSLGLVQRARGGGSAAKPGTDDATLARKVETEIFRDGHGLKGAVDLSAVGGVVWQRGEVKRPEEIKRLAAEVRSIPEVRGVENLLHLPKTPAPTRADTPRRQQRTRSSTRRPAARRRTTGRVTDARTDALVAGAEASPAEHARKRQGRTPAPMGSGQGPGSGAGAGSGVGAGSGQGPGGRPA